MSKKGRLAKKKHREERNRKRRAYEQHHGFSNSRMPRRAIVDNSVRAFAAESMALIALLTQFRKVRTGRLTGHPELW